MYLLISVIGIFFIFGFNDFFSIDSVKKTKFVISDFKSSYPLLTATIFFLIYVTGTSLSLPVAGILSITGGALFGLAWGTIIVTTAGVTGATIAFLLSRYLLREYIQNRFGNRLMTINKGIEENGNVYLLTMRLIPVIPYFVINTLMGLTPMSVYRFSLVSLFGMVPVTMILVNGGVQVASINSIGGILSFKVISAFTLIGLIPILSQIASRYLNMK